MYLPTLLPMYIDPVVGAGRVVVWFRLFSLEGEGGRHGPVGMGYDGTVKQGTHLFTERVHQTAHLLGCSGCP